MMLCYGRVPAREPGGDVPGRPLGRHGGRHALRSIPSHQERRARHARQG